MKFSLFSLALSIPSQSSPRSVRQYKSGITKLDKRDSFEISNRERHDFTRLHPARPTRCLANIRAKKAVGRNICTFRGRIIRPSTVYLLRALLINPWHSLCRIIIHRFLFLFASRSPPLPPGRLVISARLIRFRGHNFSPRINAIRGGFTCGTRARK